MASGQRSRSRQDNDMAGSVKRAYAVGSGVKVWDFEGCRPRSWTALPDPTESSHVWLTAFAAHGTLCR